MACSQAWCLGRDIPLPLAYETPLQSGEFWASVKLFAYFIYHSFKDSVCSRCILSWGLQIWAGLASVFSFQIPVVLKRNTKRLKVSIRCSPSSSCKSPGIRSSLIGIQKRKVGKKKKSPDTEKGHKSKVIKCHGCLGQGVMNETGIRQGCKWEGLW